MVAAERGVTEVALAVACAYGVYAFLHLGVVFRIAGHGHRDFLFPFLILPPLVLAGFCCLAALYFGPREAGTFLDLLKTISVRSLIFLVLYLPVAMPVCLYLIRKGRGTPRA